MERGTLSMDKIVEEGSIHVKLHTKKPPLEGEALVNLFVRRKILGSVGSFLGGCI
jgi:hypothetical protein